MDIRFAEKRTDLKEAVARLLRRFFVRPFTRVRRFFEYAPLIWHDEDYDKDFILYMLKYKIQRTRLHLADHKMRGDWQKVCAEMLEAEQIIDRILKEDWLSDEMEAYLNKHPIKWHQGKNGEMYVKSKHKNKNTAWKSLRARITELERRDWNRLGYLISRRLGAWWD